MPPLTIDPTKATMVLLAHTGWQNIAQGSLTIDTLQLADTVPVADQAPYADDYGFTYVSDSNTKITGRLSALLAISQATR